MPRVDAIVARCVAKEPTDRYGSAAELQREIRVALRDFPESQREFPTPAATPPHRAPIPSRSPDQVPASRGSGASTWILLGMGMVLLALAAGAVTWWLVAKPGAASDVVAEGPAQTEASEHQAPQEQPTTDPVHAPPDAAVEPDKTPPKPSTAGLAAGDPVDGLPVPRGAELLSKSPQALVLQGELDARAVLAFYREQAGELWAGSEDVPNGLRVLGDNAPITMVGVSRGGDGLVITLMRNALVDPPTLDTRAKGSLGERIFPGATLVAQTASAVVYRSKAELAIVIDFYHTAYGSQRGVNAVRVDNNGEPLLSLDASGADFGFSSISVLRDPSSSRSVMITVSK